MTNKTKQLVGKAVWENATSAAKMYGGETCQWMKRAIEETAGEWNLKYEAVAAAALEAPAEY